MTSCLVFLARVSKAVLLCKGQMEEGLLSDDCSNEEEKGLPRFRGEGRKKAGKVAHTYTNTTRFTTDRFIAKILLFHFLSHEIAFWAQIGSKVF